MGDIGAEQTPCLLSDIHFAASAYFELVETSQTTVLSVEELEASWETVFGNYLVPLKQRIPSLDILFLEMGYTDAIAAPYRVGALSWDPRVFVDENGIR